MMKIFGKFEEKEVANQKRTKHRIAKKRREYDAMGLKKFRIIPPAIFLRNLSVKMRLVVIVYVRNVYSIKSPM